MRARARTAGLVGLVVGVIVVIVAVWVAVRTPTGQAVPVPAPTASETGGAVVDDAPGPVPAREDVPPVDAAVYDLAGLPVVDVFAVLPALPLDPAPEAPPTTTVVTPAGAAAPVFAEPGSPPVAQLPAEQPHDGTTVPVVEQRGSWIRVLLPARQGYPSAGVAGQATGWVRSADVSTAVLPSVVTVSLSGGVAVVQDGSVVYSSSDLGYGAVATPTPLGRTFIMTTFTDPGAAYTRGLPVVALGVQSPVLDGFGGADVAVTAFHYHDDRAGAVSNGCLRVDQATIERLASLPLGTPVLITP